jgi:membrane-associated phospholipid phosphatase
MAITIFMLIKKKNVFYISFISSLIAVIILSIFYALFPSYYPRPELGAVTSISEWLVNFTRSIDGANNTFPSSHVTFAIITYLTIHEITDIKNNSYIKFIYTVWAMLICMSTLVLKQHYIVDVICAFFVATICFSIAKYLIKGGFLNSILELET